MNNKEEIYNDEKLMEEILRIITEGESGRITTHNLKVISGIIQGVISPIAKRADLNSYNKSISGVQEETSQIGFLNNSGNFVLKNKEEQKKVIKKFRRLSENRNKFIRERIREKQMEKVKPTETYIPKINEHSKQMEQKRMKGQDKIPRYKLLLEMGRLYTQEREIKQGSYMDEGEGLELDEKMNEITQAETKQQRQLKEAIQDIKLGNYVSEDAQYIEEYQTPNTEENNEFAVKFE